MIIKIKVRQEGVVYESTGLFFVDDFISEQDLNSWLTTLNAGIRAGLYKDFVKNDTVCFVVGEDKGALPFIPETAITDDIIDFICDKMSLGIDDIKTTSRSNKRNAYLTRCVVIGALRFFTKLGTAEIGGIFQRDHASVVHTCKRVLPSFYYPVNPVATTLINNVAIRYNDSRFIDACREGIFANKSVTILD
jgi:hypothetical protein